MGAPPPEPWSSEDWDRINVTDVFIHKPRIMKKAEAELIRLREQMIALLSQNPDRYPRETDLLKGQIARGENNKGFPFVSLDIPQNFSKSEFFTYRTLFWWGHYLGFSLILKGPDLKNQIEHLLAHRSGANTNNLQLACSDNLWEWELSEEYYKPLSTLSDEAVLKLVETHQFVKLLRAHPVQDKNFKDLDWAEAGVDAFKLVSDLVLE